MISKWIYNKIRKVIEVNEIHNHYHETLQDADLVLDQFNILNRKVNNLMGENDSLKRMYEDLQKDVQPLQRVVQQLRSV